MYLSSHSVLLLGQSPQFWATVDAALPGWTADPELSRFADFCENLRSEEPGAAPPSYPAPGFSRVLKHARLAGLKLALQGNIIRRMIFPWALLEDGTA